MIDCQCPNHDLRLSQVFVEFREVARHDNRINSGFFNANYSMPDAQMHEIHVSDRDHPGMFWALYK